MWANRGMTPGGGAPLDQAGSFDRHTDRSDWTCLGYSKYVKVPIVFVAILLLALPVVAWGYVERYLPLDNKELSLRFPQRVVCGRLDPEMKVRVGTTTIRVVERSDEIRFSGVDFSGKPWSFTAEDVLSGGLYSADLDHNGVVDLIYTSYTSGNGWAPSMYVLILMFDKSGRPVPSKMDGYFETDAHGLKDLVDLDGDGRAELIRQSFDDGYWITSLYEARDAHWHHIKGRHASRVFPLYTRFTNRPNHVPVSPAAGRHPTEDDLSNEVAMYTGELRAVHWSADEELEGPTLVLSGGTVCRAESWSSTTVVVVDGAGGREGATLGSPKRAHELLNTILKSKLWVELKGHDRDPDTGEHVEGATACTPRTIWASDHGASK